MSIGEGLGTIALPDPAKDPLRFMQASAAALDQPRRQLPGAAGALLLDPWGEETLPPAAMGSSSGGPFAFSAVTAARASSVAGGVQQPADFADSLMPLPLPLDEDGLAGIGTEWGAPRPPPISQWQQVEESGEEGFTRTKSFSEGGMPSTFGSGLPYGPSAGRNAPSRRRESYTSSPGFGASPMATASSGSSRPPSMGGSPTGEGPLTPLGEKVAEGEEAVFGPDAVSIKQAPQKGGFLIKHVNYVVAHAGGSVLRRYSDFVWLHDLLLRRFPFRLLPPIPPKKLQTDARFLRQRLRALRRWMDLVHRHPVLGSDALFHLFLTVRTDFTAFRRSGDVSWLDEEFGDHGLDPEQVAQIPEHLDVILSTIKITLPSLLESYRSMADLFEGMATRTLDEGADHHRFALLLDSVKTHVCYKPACPSCLATSQVDSVLSAALQDHRHIREGLGRCQVNGILESLRRHLDLLVALDELLRRSDQALAQMDMEAVQGRIALHTAKLPAATPKEGARLEALISADTDVLVYQRSRLHVIRYCLAAEMEVYHVGKQGTRAMYQAFAETVAHFSRQSAELWSAVHASLAG